MKILTILLTLLFSLNTFAFVTKTCTKAKADTYEIAVVEKIAQVAPKEIKEYIVQQTRTNVDKPKAKSGVTKLYTSRESSRADAEAQKKVDKLVKLDYVCI